MHRSAKVDAWVLSLHLLIYLGEQEERIIRQKPILQVMLTLGWLPCHRPSVCASSIWRQALAWGGGGGEVGGGGAMGDGLLGELQLF